MENSKSLIIILFSLFITGGGAAYAQTPPQTMQQQDTTNDEAAQEPEVAIQSSTIILENNHLSVEFVDVTFEDIIKEVGKKAGFSIEGKSSVFSKKVTTRFKDLETDTGVMRLLSLVKESNYRIDYDTKGTISRLKIFDIKPGVYTPQTRYTTGTAVSPAETSPGLNRRLKRRKTTSYLQPDMSEPPKTPATPQTPVARPSFNFRGPGIFKAHKEPQPAPAAPAPAPAPAPEPEPDSGDTDPPEDVQEIPYTPP